VSLVFIIFGLFDNAVALGNGLSRAYANTVAKVLFLSVWLAQLIKVLAAPAHIHSCVLEVRVQSLQRISSTLVSIPVRGRYDEEQFECTWVTTINDCDVKGCGVRWSRVAYAASGADYHTWFSSGYLGRLKDIYVIQGTFLCSDFIFTFYSMNLGDN